MLNAPRLSRALAALEKNPLPVHKRPPYPNYHPKPVPTTAAAP